MEINGIVPFLFSIYWLAMRCHNYACSTVQSGAFRFFANWRASLSAFTFFWCFGSSNRYIGNRSNQRWISQERWVRQYAPIPAASFLAEDAIARVNLSAPFGSRF
jgi:hypothetical protein